MKVAFRVDASPGIGAGHLMRCVALADALRERASTIRFVSRPLPAHLGALLVERGYDVAGIKGSSDARETAAALAGESWDWLVVDHYELDAGWETTLRPHVRHMLAIDDLADRSHDCDVLLDQNLHPRMTERYADTAPARCELLLGPRYALLREEFRRTRAHVSARIGPVARVLVSFGGGDADNHTEVAVAALIEIGADVAVDVVLPTGHPRQREIEATCRAHGFECHVQPPCMAQLMASADLAVGAAGTTTWERCCLGVPSLAVSVAGNQQEVAAEAARQGLVYLAGSGGITAETLALHLRALLENTALREMLSRNGMQAVDGRGAERIARVMDRDSIRLREATIGDADALFEWRNDEGVRSASRRSDPIPRAEHDAWLGSVLADDNRVLLIGERGGTAIGVVRFDVSGASAEVSIYRVPRSGESGLASNLLLAAESWLRERRPAVTDLTSDVLGSNERSHHVFRSTGWVLDTCRYRKRISAS